MSGRLVSVDDEKSFCSKSSMKAALLPRLVRHRARVLQPVLSRRTPFTAFVAGQMTAAL